MSDSKPLYHCKRYLLMTLDPLHIGTGGQRLGRVDNSIVREPGSKLPKIPGTSLSGAIRQYAAYQYNSPRCAGAGHGKGDNKGHCHDKDCPICAAFGYLRGQRGGQSGMVSIGDARLFLFPVYSMEGPVWVTCPSVLKEIGGTQTEVSRDKYKGKPGKTHLNLGWLMLEKEGNEEEEEFNLSDKIPAEIREQVVLVSDRLFSHVVNSNLEIRTSVSIDPETGAAADKALFTYEAIPRASWLWMDVVQDNLRGHFPETEKKCRIEEDANGNDGGRTGEALAKKWKTPLDVVHTGLKMAEYLGIGGMGTRGFGRIRIKEVQCVKQDSKDEEKDSA